MIEIRPEQSGDYNQIRDLIVRVFTETYGSGEDEARLVEEFRRTEGYDARLSQVAVDGDVIVGHVLLSGVSIETEVGEVPALVMAPLGVDKQYSGQGIGSRLVQTVLEVARKMGYSAVFVAGSPRYYGRFGFTPARPKGLVTPFPEIPEPEDMVLELIPGKLDRITGNVKYPEIWDVFM